MPRLRSAVSTISFIDISRKSFISIKQISATLRAAFDINKEALEETLHQAGDKSEKVSTHIVNLAEVPSTTRKNLFHNLCFTKKSNRPMPRQSLG